MILLRDSFVAALQMPPKAPSSSGPLATAMMIPAAAATCMSLSTKAELVISLPGLLEGRGGRLSAGPGDCYCMRAHT